MDFSVLDDIVQVEDKESLLMTRDLIKKEGIFAGGSSGAAIIGALKYGQSIKNPQFIVTLLPDSGDRYLSKIFNDDWMRENGLLESKASMAVARDILVGKAKMEVKVAHKSDSQSSVIDKMKEYNISQLPVFEGNRLLGVIGEVSLLRYLAHNKNISEKDTIEKLIKKNVYQASLDEPLENISKHIQRNDVVVIYEGGKCLGIITKIDLITYYKSLTHHS